MPRHICRRARAMTGVRDIIYRPRGPFGSMQAGAHPARAIGGVGVFRDHAPFLNWPDARRIDLRATLRDPFEGTHVRRFEMRSAIEVVVVIDLSASMSVGASGGKFEIACDLAAAIAFSCVRIGDRFRLVACAESIRFDMPATRSAARALSAVESVKALGARETGAASASDLGRLLGRRRRLVFLLSDFYWPRALLDGAFGALSRHDVAPIVLVDALYDSLPDWGLIDMADAESGERRFIFMRPALKKRWAEREMERNRLIRRAAAGRARRPIFLCDGFDPVDISLQLMAA
jgi:uncharacterized protein (DUF58 family)